MLHLRVTHAVVALLAVSCANGQPQPMTAAEHRREAEQHESHSASLAVPDELLVDGYGPAYGARFAAPLIESERQHAEQHRQIAARLERAAAGACAPLTFERRTCPFVTHPIDAAALSERGVALHLREAAPVESLRAELSCYVAQARVDSPAEQRANCPLFVNGVTTRVVTDGDGVWIVLEVRTRDGARELLRRVDALLERTRGR